MATADGNVVVGQILTGVVPWIVIKVEVAVHIGFKEKIKGFL